MNAPIKFKFVLTLLAAAGVLQPACAQKTPLKRTESFFGLHYDFHATQNDKNVGANLTTQMVDSVLKVVQPDFIQVDAKGHGGVASYPTKVGFASADIKKDPMRLFRDVTAKRGVALYAHFSGIWDAEAIKIHPDWARKDKNGNADKTTVSMFSPYVDKSFIPQIEELSSQYGINGVWVDGDSWYAKVDYSAPALDAYRKSRNLPATAKIDDRDLLNFTRTYYHQYLNHYVTTLRKFNPNLEVISNWAYSSFMPGKVDVPVDFLSGDISRTDAFNNAEFESRVFDSQGLRWDLMSWGFTSDPDGTGYYFKPAIQLQQEAAAVLSQGGSYQIYTNQKRDASLPLNNLKILKEMAQFCRERQAFVMNTQAVPQVAVLFSEIAFQQASNQPFSSRDGSLGNLKNNLKLLLDLQISANIIQEYQIADQLNNYKYLFVSDWKNLDPTVIKQINTFSQKGGRVLVMGEQSTAAFNKQLGRALSSKVGSALSSTFNKSNIPFVGLPNQKGKITFINQDVSLRTQKGVDRNQNLTDLKKVIVSAFGEDVFLVTNSNAVHVSLRKKGNDLLLHLTNNQGKHADLKVPTFSEIPKVNNIQCQLPVNAKPSSVVLQPENKAINFTYSNGKLQFEVPELLVHSIVSIKY